MYLDTHKNTDKQQSGKFVLAYAQEFIIFRKTKSHARESSSPVLVWTKGEIAWPT